MIKKEYTKPEITRNALISSKNLHLNVPISGETTPEESDAKEIEFSEDNIWK